MSTLPDFTGPGFFAGEAPDGLTTIAGTPTSASVRVYWRDPADPDAPDVLVAQTASAPDGTWRITGLNPALSYVVRARKKSNFNDATVVGARPSRSDVITYVDHLEPTEEFDGLTGYVLLDSGLPPFTCQVIQPLPFGLTARVEGRKLLIEGRSDDAGSWESVVRVTASNGVWVDVPVQVRIAWTPASLAVAPKIWIDDQAPITEVSGSASAISNYRGSIGGSFNQSNASYRPQILSAELAGRRVIRFNNSIMRMTGVSAGNLFRNVGSGWSFIVLRKRTVDAESVARIVLYAPNATGASRFNLGVGDVSPNQNKAYFATRRQDGDSTAVVRGAVVDTDWQIRRTQMLWSSNQLTDYINGSLSISAAPLTSSGNTSNTAAAYSNLDLGADGGAGATPQESGGDVDIACVLVGSGSVPSDVEWQCLEGWAAHRYGLTDNLPVDHPYKEVAP